MACITPDFSDYPLGLPEHSEPALWHITADGELVNESETGGYVFLLCPERPLTRDQMASFLTRLVQRAGGDLPSRAVDAFTDDAGHVHERAIDRLAAAGIVRGTEAGRYEPDTVVSREQMATFLVRTYEHITGRTLQAGETTFTDTHASAHRDSIAKAATAGFATGRSASMYAPSEGVRPDQMASFFSRVLVASAAG